MIELFRVFRFAPPVKLNLSQAIGLKNDRLCRRLRFNRDRIYADSNQLANHLFSIFKSKCISSGQSQFRIRIKLKCSDKFLGSDFYSFAVTIGSDPSRSVERFHRRVNRILGLQL